MSHDAGSKGAAKPGQQSQPAQAAADEQLIGRTSPARAASGAAQQIHRSLNAWADRAGDASPESDRFSTKIHRAGKDPLRGNKRDQMGTGPEAGAMHVGNASQAGMARPPQHHVFPQEQRKWFSDRGLMVDAYCVNLDQAHHEAIHAMDWNGEVMSVMNSAEKKKGKKLTSPEMLALVAPILSRFQIKPDYVQYGSERP